MSSSAATDSWTTLLDDPDICEVGGEHTNDGVDYARFLAMVLLVEMEKAELPDYALLFEYLQDIAIVDSSSAPTKATLLQVKKKGKGNWTKALLCKNEATESGSGVAGEKGQDSSLTGEENGASAPAKKKHSPQLGARSPLGKLYLCVEKLSAIIETEGVFISNAGSDLKGASGSAVPAYSRSTLQHLHSEDLEYIRTKLCSELKQATLTHLSRLAVEQSRVIPASMRETVRGLLDEMLTEKYPGLPSVSGQLQEKLLAAFSACSGPPGAVNSLQDLFAKKGFTRSTFTALVSQFASMRTAASHLDLVIGGLKSEGMAYRAADKLRAEAGRLQIQLVREPQTKEMLLWDVAVAAAQNCVELDEYKPALDSITAELKAQAVARAHGPTNDREAQAVALLALIYVNQEPTPPGSQPSDQIQ